MHKRIVWAVAAIMFFEFADLNTFSYVAPALKRLAGYTLDDVAMVTSAGFLGMFCGAVLAGRVSDRIGRRRTLTWATALFSVFSLLTAAGTDVWFMAAARFCTGVGLSAMTVSAISFLSEAMPAAYRGRAQSTTLAVGLAGIPAIAFLARGVIPIGAEGWRVVFLVGGLGLLVVPVLARLPESPRWLLHAGRTAEAREVNARLGDPHVALIENTGPHRDTSIQALATLAGRPLRRRSAVMIATWILAMLGFYAFAAWVPSLLAEHGLSLATSLTFSAITTIGAVPGALLARAVSDRFSRKWTMAVTSTMIAACGVAYGFSSDPVGIIVFGLLVSLLSQTFVALIYTYTPEVFPLRVRAFGCGVSYGAGRLANVFGPMLIPSLYLAWGYSAVFVAVAVCWVGAGAIVALFGPETTGAPLESVSDPDVRPSGG
ncbi:MFS transporter [Amycolatopsis rhabdoformis]|uniref:MFS transporter n=1 Tax=Amycolatopsis rhabdoformis TaxID=1448059 RepID=A0ABZ1IJK6_9PSEU|nr:MFS transporter [Amycolatopsis rhabdoformis]WSE34591.1 MFS transporter [Amycolatopsis rhabdoformis]